MSKAKKYAVQGAIGGGLVTAIINTIKQLNRIEENPGEKFNLKELLIEAGKGVVVGGVSGYAVGAVADHFNAQEKPLDTDAFLQSIVDKIKLNPKDSTYIRLSQKADALIALIKKEYGNILACDPMWIGSTQKGTALNRKCDIDIALSFKKNSFSSTAVMFEDVLAFLKKQVGKNGLYSVRSQNVSIGLIYYINGKECSIDVVPQKRTHNGRSRSGGYLRVNDKGWLVDNSTYTKTDFTALNNVSFSRPQKQIIILLKKWKKANDLPLSSHLLENLVLDAYYYNRGRIPRSLTAKVVMVLQHIAENLDVAYIRSVENSNNILTDFSAADKALSIGACVKAIEEYKYQPNSIIDLFKL